LFVSTWLTVAEHARKNPPRREPGGLVRGWVRG
jgi:hypothetical protein